MYNGGQWATLDEVYKKLVLAILRLYRDSWHVFKCLVIVKGLDLVLQHAIPLW